MKKLVVLGGGFAGSLIAKKLEKKFSLTLIDSKDYFEFTPGILRAIANPVHLKTIHVRYADYLKNSGIITAEIIKVMKACILLKGRKIGFDYLCICLGSSYAKPIKEQNMVLAIRASHLAESHKLLKAAKKILVIGGGLVGVELAAEICTHYKNKEITLIHSKPRLIERTFPKASGYAEEFLKKNNVKIMLNTPAIISRHKQPAPQYELAFLCTGIKPNSEPLKPSFQEAIDDKGFIRVNAFLQVKGCKNIFAAGDIAAVNIEKTAQNAKAQAALVVANILALENRQSLKTYNPRPTPIIISLGKFNGIFVWKSFAFSGLIPAVIKFIIEKKEMLGLKNPFRKHLYKQ